MIDRSFFIACLFLTMCGALLAQNSTRNYAVEVSAVATTNPPSLKFSWTADAASTGYTVYRKAKTAGFWGFPQKTLSGSDTTWTDTTVNPGAAWEYNFVKSGAGFFSPGAGYIYAGIEFPAIETRGTILLIIDSTYRDSMPAELDRLEMDLIGDGWNVIRHEVDRNDSVPDIKAYIQSEYNADPANVKMVFLFGHVPVPYSGNINPDAHPDHLGAWPADVYYAEIDGKWTDSIVNNGVASRTKNKNFPYDGKFDQSQVPGTADLMVGRIDFEDMPAFAPEGEWDLLKKYLEKDHAFRHKEFTGTEIGVIDDNFGVLGAQEAFAASAWRGFSPLVKAKNLAAGDYRTTLQGGATYLVSYGCGGGSYSSASGIGTTSDFATDSLRGVFTFIFGSYHGDWDSQNNFMRAALANKGTILTCGWSGRPHWHFHHMGLGETIGYAARLTQNNSSLYFSGYAAKQVHIGLMGDPSLRLHVVAPAKNLAVTTINSDNDNLLAWTASADSVLGYWIYHSMNAKGPYTRISPAIVNDTTFTDSCPAAGANYYMLRAIVLQDGASGSYYNLSQGIFGNTTNTGQIAMSPFAAGPLCAGDTILVSYQVTGAYCESGIAYAELSDSSGAFLTPDTIGSVSGSASGPVVAVIPGGTISGKNYRIRISIDDPGYVSADNGSAIEIKALPSAGFAFLQSGDTIFVTNSTIEAQSYQWDFGDGNTDTNENPVHVYSTPGNYLVTLVAFNSCGSDTLTLTINTVGINLHSLAPFNIWPNPSDGKFKVRGNFGAGSRMTVFNSSGILVHSNQLSGGGAYEFDLSEFGMGIYLVVIRDGEKSASRITVLSLPR